MTDIRNTRENNGCYDFGRHPEQREDEVFFTNIVACDGRTIEEEFLRLCDSEFCSNKRRLRMGRVAYDNNWRVYKEGVPVFCKKERTEKND